MHGVDSLAVGRPLVVADALSRCRNFYGEVLSLETPPLPSSFGE